MISVVLIGYGNVSHHLTSAFLKAKNVKLLQIYARSIEKVEHLKNKTNITNSIESLLDADIYIIAVSDDAIPDVSAKIKNRNAFVVHTSGSNGITKLAHNGRKGVFYMLQSFSKDKAMDFNTIPFCLEAENEKDLQLLGLLAKEIGEKIYHIDSKKRQILHVSAVFVNNFTNHLYKIGNDICNTHNVPFEILHPIIQETALKIKELSPKAAQTGPARREDKQTIKNHLSLLDKHQQEIYKLLSKSIQNEYKL